VTVERDTSRWKSAASGEGLGFRWSSEAGRVVEGGEICGRKKKPRRKKKKRVPKNSPVYLCTRCSTLCPRGKEGKHVRPLRSGKEAGLASGKERSGQRRGVYRGEGRTGRGIAWAKKTFVVEGHRARGERSRRFSRENTSGRNGEKVPRRGKVTGRRRTGPCSAGQRMTELRVQEGTCPKNPGRPRKGVAEECFY